MQDLVIWFEKAGLSCRVDKDAVSRAFSIGNFDIFQMSIDTRGKKRKREFFRIFPGAIDNDVRVIDADPIHKQVILFVHEPEREFKRLVWNREKKRNEEVTEKTPDFIRKYLMGFDEKQYFIAELPSNLGAINKVSDAHRILKPKEVTKQAKETKRIKRQGEWFFIPASAQELDLIEAQLEFIEKKERIGDRAGNSHIADRLLRIRGDEFVSGKIAHIEHKTLKLRGWFRVLQNNESPRTAITSRFNWID